jgi:hypothetical protein
MTIAANIAARDRYTASLRGSDDAAPLHASQEVERESARPMSEAEEALFGWVYKQPGMPTFEDCKAILSRVYAERGSEETTVVLQRFGTQSISDLWIGLYQAFHDYCKTILNYGISPAYGWTGPDDVPTGMRDRWLLWHAESECLYEVRGSMPDELVLGEVSDVSGVDEFEKRFIAEQIGGKDEL